MVKRLGMEVRGPREGLAGSPAFCSNGKVMHLSPWASTLIGVASIAVLALVLGHFAEKITAISDEIRRMPGSGAANDNERIDGYADAAAFDADRIQA